MNAQNFYSLTPEIVLSAVEMGGHRTTGLCYALNSLENRVYDVELEDRSRVIVKFYRPGRWSRETILDEHHFLHACVAHDIPVCAPMNFADGTTLKETDEGIFAALFPRVGGRAPDELFPDDLEQLGRYIARIHRVGEVEGLKHRPTLSPATYGTGCLNTILSLAGMSPGVGARYRDAALQLIAIAERMFADHAMIPIHADLHRGNLLRQSNGAWMVLDFDDMAFGPAVQDFWLLLPGRAQECPQELEALTKGYEQFRDLDSGSYRLIEVLRGLRYIRYAAWITERRDDPAFARAFPQYGTDSYWEMQMSDLYEQLRAIEIMD